MVPAAGSIRISPQGPGGIQLRVGELVSVQVLDRLAGGRWMIGIQGRVLPASSGLPLEAGSRLLARVNRAAGSWVLAVLDRPTSALRDLAVREGLPADKATERILAAFLASGLKVQPGEVRRVHEVLQRLKLPPQRFARLAVQLLEKNIDLASPGIAALLPLLGFGEGGGRRRRPGGRREPEAGDAGAALKKSLEGSPEREPGLFALFNHLRSASQQWLIVPIRYGALSGTLRLLCAGAGEPVRRVVLIIDGPRSGRWSFVLTRREARDCQLVAFRQRVSGPAVSRRQWRDLAHKLQNLGVQSDDTIRMDDEFDGFALPWEQVSYRGVDTLG